jgi:hypothetical protein
VSNKPITRYLTKGGEITGDRSLTVDLTDRPNGLVRATCNGCAGLTEDSAPRATAWAEKHANACRAVR